MFIQILKQNRFKITSDGRGAVCRSALRGRYTFLRTPEGATELSLTKAVLSIAKCITCLAVVNHSNWTCLIFKTFLNLCKDVKVTRK